MIKLTKNYRSHSAILNFPNEKFYKNELQACADRAVSHCISGRWRGLVRRDFPVIFHGVCGQDEREDPSPSYFNADEASIVRDYVKSLLNDKGLNLSMYQFSIIFIVTASNTCILFRARRYRCDYPISRPSSQNSAVNGGLC